MRLAMQHATLENTTLVLDLFQSFRYPGLFHDVAGKCFLSLVQLPHDRGLACSRDAMDLAAYYDHLEVVTFLHSQRGEGCSVRAMDYAATEGHFDVVQYLHSLGSFGCTNALSTWLLLEATWRSPRFSWPTEAKVAPATTSSLVRSRKGSYKRQSTFSRSGIRWYTSPLREPEMVDVVELYLDNGGPLDEGCMMSACGANNRLLVQLLHEHPSNFSGPYSFGMSIKDKA